MLLAGAGVGSKHAFGGAFTFSVGDPPSWTAWSLGSAYFLFIFPIVYYIYDLDMEASLSRS